MIKKCIEAINYTGLFNNQFYCWHISLGKCNNTTNKWIFSKNMMKSSYDNIFRVTGPLCGEFTGQWWIPFTKASDAELWCFLWSAPEQTVERNETPVIWDAIALIMSSLYLNDIKFMRFVGALSSWMGRTGYYLAGHTRKEKVAVPTVEDCWETCMQETDFKCLSVAYAAVGNRSCRLYDKKALSVYRDWTRSAELSYYEFCVNGGFHNLMHSYFATCIRFYL